MVVIDAEKHGLDYKQSEKDNGISALKEKYQGGGGASTLLSRAKSQKPVPKRQGSPKVNEDGSLSWKTADDLYYEEKRKVRVKDENGKYVKDKDGKYVFATDEKGKPIWESTGKIKERTQVSTKMAEEKDAHKLISKADTPQERAYADYANYMKSLANAARKEATFNTPNFTYSKEAKTKYQAEVDSLDSKLKVAKMNAPREKQAQIIAASTLKAKKQENPSMTKADERKISQKALSAARIQVGASRQPVEISDKEWEAIQAGAISPNKLTQILKNSDKDRLRQLATPRQSNQLSDAKINQIKAMQASGYTNQEIAKRVGCSPSTVIKYL
jgi:DNA-binding NarL/FixJ family response regulator